jgi:hypothetical protein
MKKILFSIFLVLITATGLYADQVRSIVTEVEGLACMGRDKSVSETETMAMQEAKRKAAEYAATYIKSETEMKDFILEKDLVAAYTRAMIKILQELDKSWFKDPASGQCYRIKIKAEVVPDEGSMKKIADKDLSDNPNAPLTVKVYTDKSSYRAGEKIKIFLKGNRPFFANIIYKNADGQLLQLLPNPYRQQNYFQGGAVFEIPSGDDKYDLEVTEPFGTETVTVYASSSQIGDLDIKPQGAVYEVKTKPRDIAVGTRGVKFSVKDTQIKEGGSVPRPAAQFIESSVTITTTR